MNCFKGLMVFLMVGMLSISTGFSQKISAETWHAIDIAEDNAAAIVLFDSVQRNTTFIPEDSLRWLLEKAKCCFWMSNFGCSIELGHDALELSKALKNDSSQMAAWVILATTDYYLGKGADGIEKINNALAVSSDDKYWLIRATMLSNQGAMLIDEKRQDEAEVVLKSCIKIFEEQDQIRHAKYWQANRLLASAFHRQKKFSQAKSLYYEVIENAAGIGDSVIIGGLAMAFTPLFVETGQLDSALYFAELSVKVARKFQFDNDLIGALTSSVNINEALGNYKDAYRDMREISIINSRIYTKNLEDKVSEVKVKYETEQERQAKELAMEQAKSAELALVAERSQKQRLALGLLAVVLIAAIAFLVFYLKNQRKQAQLEKEVQATRLGALVEGEDQERSRIARDLHDGISQLLFGVKLRLQVLELNDEQLLKILSNAIDEVRAISHNLAPTDMSEAGFMKALRQNAERINQSNQLAVELVSEIEQLPLNQMQQTNLFRIAQEVLNNTLKHAAASKLILEVNLNEKSIQFIAKDNGKGMDTDVANAASGIGWNNIKARLQVLNGQLKVESSPNNGTQIFISIPIAA